MKGNRCLIFAHRGASAYLPANSLEAFELALNQGADAVEMDVRQTGDGKLVVWHSNHVRKGLRPWRVNKLTLSQLNALTGGVATLEEIFKRFAGKVLIDLDIKDAAIKRSLAKLLKKYCIGKDKIFLNSNKIEVVDSLRSELPEYRYVLSYNIASSVDISERKVLQTVLASLSRGVNRVLPQRFKRKAVKAKVYGVSLPYSFIYQGLVSYFHHHDIRVYAWPPNSERTLKRLITMGVDGIKTGKPDLLARLLSGLA